MYKNVPAKFTATPVIVNRFTLNPPNAIVPTKVCMIDLTVPTTLVVRAEFIVVHKKRKKLRTHPELMTIMKMIINLRSLLLNWLVARPNSPDQALQKKRRGSVLKLLM